MSDHDRMKGVNQGVTLLQVTSFNRRDRAVWPWPQAREGGSEPRPARSGALGRSLFLLVWRLR